MNGELGTLTVSHKYDYYKTTWKLNEIVQSPLDGKAFTIESVGQPGRFIIPYMSEINAANGAYASVHPGANQQSYGRWIFAQVGADGDKPYFIIYSAHNGSLLERSPSGDRVYASGNYPGGLYTRGDSSYWFVQTNSDGTYTLISKADGKKAAEIFDDGAYRMRFSALGSTPTDNQKWKLAEVDPNADYIDGKVFYLSPKHAGSDKVMDLEGNGTSNGTKVQLYDKYETEIQRWRFERAGTASKDGKTVKTYYIHSVHAPGKALDVPGGSTSNGTRPQLYDFSATNNNQKWILEDAGEGYYYIIPYKDSTRRLGCSNGGTGNNTAVVLWEKQDIDNQKWKLTETIAPVELGTFELESVGKADWTIDVYSDSNDSGAHVQIYPAHQRDYTRWTFVQMGTDTHDAYYKIVNKASGKVMDISGYGRENVKEGAEVLQANYDFRNDQLWYLSKGSDSVSDYYYIYNKADSYYKLAVKDSKYEKNQYIVLTSSWGDNTKWRLKQDFKPVDLGTYEFGLNDDAHANMRMDVFGGSTDNGANIQVWHSSTSTEYKVKMGWHPIMSEYSAFELDESKIKQIINTPIGHMYGSLSYDGYGNLNYKEVSRTASPVQTFRVIQRGSDLYNGEITPYYSIENTRSKKSLDPGGTADTYDGLNIGQYDYDGYADQHWFLEVRGDDSVVFRNRNDPSLVLTADGTDDGKTVLLKTYDDKKLSTQSWRLHPIMLTSNGRYYLPGNAAAAAAGIPYVEDQDVTVEPLALGKYTLTPQHAASMRMDLTAGNTGNGTKIQLYANNGANGQRWQFIPAGVDCFDGDGRVFYRLAFGSDANKVAETSGYGPVTASLDIRIWDSDGGYDQQWYLEEVGGKEDTYYLIGRGTLSQAKKICLGAPAGATASGTQLQTATLQNKTYQQWQLEPVD